MIWIVPLIVVFAGITYAFSKLRLKPDLAADVSSEVQGSRSHVAVRTESQLSGSHDDLPSGGYEYEVFLSFRGSDTRKGFTDCLYHALHEDAGVRTFRDDEELRPGEEIGGKLLKAIAESKIYVPIFSKNYASSKWCLKELTFMLERKKAEENHMILPVFYDVTPTEVQDHTQYYGRALRKHEKKYDAEIVQQWREALSEVGRLKGMDLVNLANGCEGKLIKLIVLKVLRELKKAQLIVTDYLVGIDDHVEAVKQLLQLGAPEVRIIGLWGMGGIGKTTLSKVIYNHIYADFEGYSFIGDVRETSGRNGLNYLQSSLVANLSRCAQPHFASVDEGIHELKERYRRKKVLILLDDIDDTNQLDALVIRHDSFGPGSRIILTTRNRDVLDRHQVDHIYEVEAMNEDAALKLFCKHAFRKDTPTVEFSGLSDEIVKTTGGLPLALEVIGSSLSSKRKAIWKGTLEKLRIIPNKDVHEKLRISFEALDYELKQIFLDIACFFIGDDMSKIFPMWEDCKFFPEIGIDILIAKSLIKIGDNNSIWMHNEVRDLGREIVRQENCEELGKRSRLWHTEKARDVLAKHMGSSNVEAIRMHCYALNEEQCNFESEQFRTLSRLRFLDLDNHVRLVGDFENLLPSLQWLRWTDSSFNSLFNLHMPNLVSLELEGNDIRDDWKGWVSIKMMKLKVLNLKSSRNLERTPDFSAFPHLERLILSHCAQLKVIDPSIAKLKNLTLLDISSCSSIEELPEIMDAKGLAQLDALESLDISRCPAIRKLPDLSNLKLLKELCISGCTNLEELVGIDHLYALQSLDISHCRAIKRLPNFSSLALLRQLHALKELNISSCTEIERSPDLSKFKQLEALYTQGCVKLHELMGLDELKALKILKISFCKEIEYLPDLSNLKQLRELHADGCEKLQDLIGLDELKSLEILRISYCKEIEELPDLSMLKQLKEFDVTGCEKLQELVGLCELKALQRLTISGSKVMENLPDLSKLKQLEEFHARDCVNRQQFAGLDKLRNLHASDIKEKNTS